jgi:hypothetical protein
MSATTEPRELLDERIDALESGYEFLLAYAAQGRTSDKGAGAASRIREHLEAMQQALDGLVDAVRSVAATDPQGAGTIGAPFFAALDRDAATARSAIRLVLSRPDISSQLVDNLNASIHVRALLTDLFVIDEVLKQRPTA